MTRVYYMVGTDGYFTRCNTLASAEKQKSAHPRYIIRTCYEEIIEEKPKLSEKRLAWLKNKNNKNV